MTTLCINLNCASKKEHVPKIERFIRTVKEQILNAVNNNILKNLPILREDVRMAEDIYGPSIPHLKGKTVRRKVQHVEPVKIKNVRSDKMHYHELGYSFERHGGSGGYDALLNSPDEALNFREMFLFWMQSSGL